MKHRFHRRRGATLMEVTLAAAFFAILIALIYASGRGGDMEIQPPEHSELGEGTAASNA
jgi:hypothetical protein